MKHKEVEKEIRGILSKSLNILRSTGKSVEDIKNDEYFIEDLGIDSIGIMALIADIEKTFNIKIGQGELSRENFGNIDFAVKYISKKLRKY